MFNFRRFFRRSVAAGCVLLFWITLASAASPTPDHVILTWTQDPKTTQTISWRTDTATTVGQVRFGPDLKSVDPNGRSAITAALTNTLEITGGAVNIHSATLTALTPGMRYRYQVGYGSIWSDAYTFKTESREPASFKFLVFGDSQSVDYGTWRTTLQAAARKNPDAAFFVNMGDLVDVGQDYGQWESWFAASAGVIENIPVMPLTGNHEYYTPERRFSSPLFFTAQFALPENGPEGMKRQVYSFNYGEVHFVMLDSQEGEQRRFLPDLLDRQRQWLEADLAMNDSKWKVVFIHSPLYGNKPNGINENLLRTFAGVFDKYQVDLVFTAHDHVYARTAPMYNIEDGAARDSVRGTIHVSTGRTGSKTYDNVSEKTWNIFFHNPIAEPMYLSVKSTGDVLNVTAMGVSGQLIDDWTLVKTNSKSGE
ncbi:MAG: purple acid phosphatase family protein [Negativicutes bacterium]